MAIQAQVPGGAYVNETTARQSQIPGFQYYNDTTAGGGGGSRVTKMAGEWGGYAGSSGGFAG